MPRTKGTTLLGAVRFLRHHRERSRDLLEPELQHYLEERIHESKWYPEEDLQALIEAMLVLIPGPRDEVLAEMGARTAREHLEGIYSHLRASQEEAGPSRSKAFALWASQHDSGRLELERVGPGERIMTVHDFGHPSEVMCGIFAGYFEEVVRFEGAHDVKASKRECVLKGDTQCAWLVTSRSGDACSLPSKQAER